MQRILEFVFSEATVLLLEGYVTLSHVSPNFHICKTEAIKLLSPHPQNEGVTMPGKPRELYSNVGDSYFPNPCRTD